MRGHKANSPPGSIEGGYDPSYFAPLFAAEDRHFWFRARRSVIRCLTLQITGSLAAGYRVLEVGCGTGDVLRVLDKVCVRGQVMGMDLFKDGLRYARKRTDCPLVQGDVTQHPFGTHFELIGLFDVLEHIQDDVKILSELREMLAPGGALLLTVPAHQSLWSYFDDVGHHCRRYERHELRDKLKKAGFEIEYLTSFMAVLFPLIWFSRKLSAFIRSHTRKNDDLALNELQIVPFLNPLLTFLLLQETWMVARRIRLPCGSSLLAIARRAPG